MATQELRIYTTESAMHDLWQLQKDAQNHTSRLHDSTIDELRAARKLIARMTDMYDKVLGE